MGALSGKAIVVTGSGRGIGAGIVRLAAVEGASVVVNDIDAQEANSVVEQIVSDGGKAVACTENITDWNGARSLIECCVDSFGAIDGLVNNAGVFRLARVDEMTERDIRDTMDANVVGMAFTTRHATPHMIARRSGSIINVTSGAHFGLFGQGAYGASKGAAASFTYCWAADLREFDIRVNALSPMAATRMADTSDAFHGARGMTTRVLPAAELNAPVAVYLLSEQSRDVTGQVVRIDANDLSLVSHPGVALPVLTREAGWDVEAVARAFREELGKRLLPVGVVGLNVEPHDMVKRAWA